MNKNINTITEELMMRYVEGSMDSDESDKFEKILSKNEYLNNRVSILKTMVNENPLESPSSDMHKQILSNLNISNGSDDISFIKKYADYFMSVFEKRPALMGSLLSGVAAVFIFFIFTSDSEPEALGTEPYNPTSYTYNDSNQDNLDEIEDEKSSKSTTTD